ncbi:hypothetical protein [Nocardia sp. CNY236]|uniref:hypothetical protein n=1 Tax=Nocardia sp. CNY236 TaxID=1169152 RepID=UPI0004067ECB|nr:hypothetical protein [Nocardia sp. CNY236]
MTSRATFRPDPHTAPLAPIALLIGALMVVVAATQIGHVPRWASDYGALVYLAAILYLAVTSRLLWWGAQTRRQLARTKLTAGATQPAQQSHS